MTGRGQRKPRGCPERHRTPLQHGRDQSRAAPRNYAAQIFCIWQRALPVFRAYRAWPALTYPSRPITMVVPFPIGGPTDTLARTLAVAGIASRLRY